MANGQMTHGAPPEVKSAAMRLRAFGMFVIGMAMWAGVPGFWLFVGGSIVFKPGGSVAPALAVMMVGSLATIVGLIKLLGVLNSEWLEEYEELNQRKPVRTPLEPVLVISAAIALAIFGIWFTFFAGGGGPTIGPTG